MADGKQKKIKALFEDTDTSDDGTLTQKELLVFLKRISPEPDNVTADDVVEYFSQNDKNDDNKINFDEFYSVFNKRDNKEVPQSEVEEFFRKKDKDGSGCLDRKEIEALLTMCENFSVEKLDAEIERLDKDGDGKINITEFVKAFYG